VNGVSVLFLLLLAPLPYFVLGSPVLLVGPGRRPSDWLCPLLGCVLAGWISEVSLVLGIPCRYTLAVAGVVAVIVLVSKARELGRLGRCYAGFLAAYGPAVAILAVSASPATASWVNDWLEQYAMGQGVLAGDYAGVPVHREPLFAAGAIPLQLVSGGLPALMAFSAVTAASAALAIGYGAESREERRVDIHRLAPMLLSPFFLLHVITVWAKLLAAGAVVAAVVAARGYRETRRPSDWLAASFWIAAAVAVHKSSVIYLPFLALIYPFRAQRRRILLRDAAVLVGLGLLLVAPFDVWVVLKGGLKTRIEANPAIYYALRDVDPVLVKVANLISAIIGYPGGIVRSGSRSEALGFWITWQAGTLVGTFWPFLLRVGPWRALGRTLAEDRLARRLAAGGVAAVVLNALLNPYPASFGLSQTGLTPLCLLIFLRIVLSTGPRRVTLGIILLAGTLPLLGLNSYRLYACAAGGVAPDANGQYAQMIGRGLSSIALKLWPLSLPFGWAVLVGYLAFDWSGRRRRRGAEPCPVPDPAIS
jgi:hypothetical protein